MTLTCVSTLRVSVTSPASAVIVTCSLSRSEFQDHGDFVRVALRHMNG